MIAVAPRIKAPRYPQWPEKPQPFVNVLCEGPSIARLRNYELLKGPVVSINHTLSLSNRVPIDFWATIDQPSNLWDWAKPYLRDDTKLFTTANNILFWQDLIGLGVGERLYAKDPTYMVATEENEAFLDESGRPALLPTIIHVLGWLKQIPGVESVRVFGADMRGSNSNLAHSSIPFSEEEDSGWSFRWAVERKLFALATERYRKSNQRLERYG